MKYNFFYITILGSIACGPRIEISKGVSPDAGDMEQTVESNGESDLSAACFSPLDPSSLNARKIVSFQQCYREFGHPRNLIESKSFCQSLGLRLPKVAEVEGLYRYPNPCGHYIGPSMAWVTFTSDCSKNQEFYVMGHYGIRYPENADQEIYDVICVK